MIRACWCRRPDTGAPHAHDPVGASAVACPPVRLAWRVHRVLFPHAGPVGTPAWRWCVTNPCGRHKASAREHWRAVQVAYLMARDDV